ncbi:STAS domain-containing protein [Streptacidiphilus jiangxiensis]|uniref:ABC-type transporter Mla maintaining outer membrane lipid asymmetry, MlaB component, contains STAS domain n=1 Tax=Streptacidiphilus jiangxiensis TaxID=235985 RepID=A0A1H7H2Y9_STRJI|nr:STAS domain-containing protein [Streptacidiphilus jiangxiensis]SEK43662.1 ABC-type transporter Mla maintaining outer membrane lipid asymmetry, MlaB component, contains STAS domain [Streptacidiphilus jiangxiensis]
MPLTRPLRAALHPRAQTGPHPGQTLTVRGEIDFHTVGQLCRQIEDQLPQAGHLTLDLTRATFYDQAAIDALAEVQTRATRAGHRLTVTCSPTVPRSRTTPALTPA